jgi:hypothetical protein
MEKIIRMNFRFSRFLNLFVSFIAAIFFVLLGIITIFSPWSDRLQADAAHLLLTNPFLFTLFGIALVLMGLSVGAYAFIAARKRYVTIETGILAVSVDEDAVLQYLAAYWKEQFPHHHIPCHLKIDKHSLQIIADFPPSSIKEQKEFLERAQTDFTDLFGRIIGYPYNVQLIASFESKKT